MVKTDTDFKMIFNCDLDLQGYAINAFLLSSVIIHKVTDSNTATLILNEYCDVEVELKGKCVVC